MRIADYIIKRLVDLSVDKVFMVTGRGVLYLSDAVAKNDEISATSLHHEQSCAYAAQAYAIKKDGIGACIVSTGCGATNAVTGVLNAWQDGIPVVFISGQHMLDETTCHTGLSIRTYGQQEANIIEIVKSITKYAVMLEDADTAIYEIDKALHIATNGKKGPVWIDVPLDIQNARVEPEVAFHFAQKTSIQKPSSKDVQYVVDEINNSHRPVFLIGSGVRLAGGTEDFGVLAERTKIPVVFDTAAVDIFPDVRELSMGTIGAMGGSRAGNFTIQNSDLVISIGCRLNSAQVGEDPDAFAREATKIVVDIDGYETLKGTIHMDLYICSDAKLFIDSLLDNELQICDEGWIETCKHWKEIFPKKDRWIEESDKVDLYSLIDAIGDLASEGDTVISDAGIEELVVPSVVCKKEGIRVIHPASQGCMGFALPASIGAYYSDRGNVIAIIGDGSFMMNLQELESIRYNHIPVKLFIINNNSYDVIRQRQKELFRNRTIGTDKNDGISCSDFKSLAKAFQISYRRIDESSELLMGIGDVLDMKEAVICEVIAREDQPFLRNSYIITNKHKLIKRHLEDQKPFMDRELFHKEMIVNTTDDYMEG